MKTAQVKELDISLCWWQNTKYSLEQGITLKSWAFKSDMDRVQTLCLLKVRKGSQLESVFGGDLCSPEYYN